MTDFLDTVTSPEYRELNKRLHLNGPFGHGGGKHANKLGAFKGTILDYGCGKQALSKKLEEIGIKVTDYDPCIPGLDSKPEPHDFVFCTDVLEHVEPEYLENVLEDLKRVTKKQAFVVISTAQSHKKLPDGSSPHRIVENHKWWSGKLSKYFKVTEKKISGLEFEAYLEVP